MAEITWIKIKTDMFNDEKIKLIERMPEGDGILIIWVKLLAYAGKVNCGGYIMIADNIPMNIEEMAIIFNRPLEKVRYAITALQRYRMIEIDENETVCITNWDKHQNIEGMEKVRLQNRTRKQKQREREKQGALPSPSHVTSRDSHATDKEEELDKDIDKETEREKEKEKEKTPSSHPLIDQDFLNIQNHYKDHVVYRDLDYKETLFINDLMEQYEPQLIIEAMNVAVLRQKPNLAYAEGILRNWRLDGITNIQQLQAKEVSKNATTQRSNASHTPKNPAESQILQRASSYTGDISKYQQTV